MAGKNKKNAAEDLLDALLKDLKLDEVPIELSEQSEYTSNVESGTKRFDGPANLFESNDEIKSPTAFIGLVAEDRLGVTRPEASDALDAESESEESKTQISSASEVSILKSEDLVKDAVANTTADATIALHVVEDNQPDLNKILENHFEQGSQSQLTDPSEKTIAVTGFHQRKKENYEDKVRVSVGQSKSAHSPGYANWGGSVDINLAQADNLRMAQEKILELEKENEKLRVQNEELISASEIIKERSDLLSSQFLELKNDREDLEQSYKNEIALLKGHIQKKEADLERLQMKNDEMDSRLKFDMKKIRIRERELENRLELIRAEKNAIVKTKDDQILDQRRKMDVLQMEVDSYRQKCVELNKTIETNQESFKRTVRALRLAMANLELTEENKVPIKKAE